MCRTEGREASPQQPPVARITPTLRTRAPSLLLPAGNHNPLGRGLKHGGSYHTEPQEEQGGPSLSQPHRQVSSAWGFSRVHKGCLFSPDTMYSTITHTFQQHEHICQYVYMYKILKSRFFICFPKTFAPAIKGLLIARFWSNLFKVCCNLKWIIFSKNDKDEQWQQTKHILKLNNVYCFKKV